MRSTRLIFPGTLTGLAVAALIGMSAAIGVTADQAEQAPAFTHDQPRDWLKSEPLTWEAFEGEVVLVHFWTFMCWNCYRSFPWLNSLEAELAEQPVTMWACTRRSSIPRKTGMPWRNMRRNTRSIIPS